MTIDSFLPIRTERLTLRAHTEGDLPALLAYYCLPGVARYLLCAPWTQEAGRAHLAQRVDRLGVDTPARSLALVVEHEGRVVGDVVLWATDEAGAKGEIGWAFHPDVAGRGFAAEAASALLEVGFGRYGMHRVVARMDARNGASAALCERLGMRWEATYRQDCWSKGEWTDSFVYASLARDRPRRRGDAIVVSAVVLADADGSVLTVRKRGTTSFMHPGGKPEPDETPAQCALREVEEELGLALDPELLELLAVHRTAAANEAGRPLLATVFRHPHLAGRSRPEVTPAAEIDEVRWADPRHPLPADSAPLLRLLIGCDGPRPSGEGGGGQSSTRS
ncbi:GNAT family N-acetyltransferase [Janibacter sp. GS2]|uniref:GNAT family N-acetyltransferase n=1 Tax=Janibacter sp. GS2 TaxID=3442646 RepID=UPI003EBA2745